MEKNFNINRIRRIILVGKNEYAESKITFNHTSCRNELIYHLSGNATVVFNGKHLETAPDSIRFLPAGSVYEYTVERHERGECILIVFDSDVPISQEAFVLKIRSNAKIKNMFKKAFTTWVTKSDGYYFECKGLLYEIFAQLQKNNYLPDYQFSLIKPAVDYIHNNFLNKRITAEDLCSCCTISYTYLKKLFVKCFGMPPLKYAINLRINYACELLIYGQYSISEVSEMCGYKDVYFFSRQFKSYAGITPSNFIDRYKSSK